MGRSKPAAKPQATTASEVAQWMLTEFAKTGYLAQVDAVDGIEKTFGEAFVRLNDDGNRAVPRAVLAAFRKLSPDVVWDRYEKAWRARDSGDDPAKRQGQ